MSSHLGGALLEGSDTTASVVQGFVLVLSAFPEAQKRAHEEMDAVVGIEEPPKFEDLKRLPYMRAILDEVGSCHSLDAFPTICS